MKYNDKLSKISRVFFLVILFLCYSSNPVFAESLFGFKPLELGIGLSYDFDREVRGGPNIDSKDLLHDLRARIEMETIGWVYHRALCEYNIKLIPEYILSREEHTSTSESKNDIFAGYSAEIRFLQFKPYTLRLFGERSTLPERGTFATVSEIERDYYGAQLLLKYDLLPSSFYYTHSKDSQRGFYSSTNNMDQFSASTSHSTDRTRSSFRTGYTTRERTFQEITTESKDLNSYFNNSFNITDDGKIVLTSFLSQYRTESDFSETSGFRISEILDWRHLENLRTNYHLGYNHNESNEFSIDTTVMNAVLTHELYENLTTMLSGGVSLDDFTGGEEKAYFGAINLDYQRKIPLGMLSIGTVHGYRTTSRERTEGFIQVIDESHILRTGDLTFLDNEKVDVGSIKVTDASRTILYVEGFDYTVQQIGNSVRISRTVLGSISDGQEVLVSYTYEADPSFDDEILNHSYRLGLFLWDHLNLSYSYSTIEQTVISGIPPDTLIDDTTSRAEMELDWRFTNTKLSYEDAKRQSGTSVTEWEAEETLTFRPFWRFFASLEGRYGKRDFEIEGKEDYYGLRLRADYIPFAYSKLEMGGFLYDVSGDLQDVYNTGFSTLFEFSRGLLSFRVRYEYLNEENMRGDETEAETRNLNRIMAEIVRKTF